MINYRRVDLFSIFRKAMLSDPEGSRKDAFERFLSDLERNRRSLRTLAEDYFDRASASWKVEKIGDSYSLIGTAAVQRRVDVSTTQRAEKQKHADIVKQGVERIRQLVLLDIILPTGKKLRDSTGAECTRAGGFFAEVARHLKPTEVVPKHLSEQELRNIWVRFGNKPKNLAASARSEVRAGV